MSPASRSSALHLYGETPENRRAFLRNADERKRRLRRPATAATVFISAGNRERAGYLSRREKLVFRFPRLWNCCL